MSRSDHSQLVEELAAAERPSVAKCVPLLSPEARCKLEAKSEFAAELKATELSNRAAAKLLGVTEGCVRAWLDPNDLRRNPPKWATAALGYQAKLCHARLAVNAIKKASGTDG